MRKYYLLFLIAFLTLQCEQSKDQLKCIDSGEFQICTPTNWNSVKTEKAIFFSGLSDSLKNTFAIMQSLDLDWSPEQYIIELNRQLREDTTELFTGYTLKQLQIDNTPTNTYYSEVYTKFDGQEYVGIGMVWRDNKNLNEFTIKRLNSDYSTAFDEMSKIIFNLKRNGEPQFNKESKLDYKLISFEELGEKTSP